MVTVTADSPDLSDSVTELAYYVWTKSSKHVEVAQQLSFSSSSYYYYYYYYYSTADLAKLFLPQFTSSSSKSFFYVTFRHKRSFKWHYNNIKTL